MNVTEDYRVITLTRAWLQQRGAGSALLEALARLGGSCTLPRLLHHPATPETDALLCFVARQLRPIAYAQMCAAVAAAAPPRNDMKNHQLAGFAQAQRACQKRLQAVLWHAAVEQLEEDVQIVLCLSMGDKNHAWRELAHIARHCLLSDAPGSAPISVEGQRSLMDIRAYLQQQSAAAFAARDLARTRHLLAYQCEVQTLRQCPAAAQRVYDDAQDLDAWEALSAALAALDTGDDTTEVP